MGSTPPPSGGAGGSRNPHRGTAGPVWGPLQRDPSSRLPHTRPTAPAAPTTTQNAVVEPRVPERSRACTSPGTGTSPRASTANTSPPDTAAPGSGPAERGPEGVSQGADGSSGRPAPPPGNGHTEERSAQCAQDPLDHDRHELCGGEQAPAHRLHRRVDHPEGEGVGGTDDGDPGRDEAPEAEGEGRQHRPVEVGLGPAVASKTARIAGLSRSRAPPRSPWSPYSTRIRTRSSALSEIVARAACERSGSRCTAPGDRSRDTRRRTAIPQRQAATSPSPRQAARGLTGSPV